MRRRFIVGLGVSEAGVAVLLVYLRAIMERQCGAVGQQLGLNLGSALLGLRKVN